MKNEGNFVFEKMTPAEIIVYATSVGLLIAEGLTIDQQNAVGNFFLQVGQTITVYASQQQLREDLNPPQVAR